MAATSSLAPGAAGVLLLLLCALAVAPTAEAGPRCGSALLCPDEGWYCCAAARESCCKNIGTGGSFGRRLRTVEMVPSGDPLLPPTVNIWQAGRLLHTTSPQASARRLAQTSEIDPKNTVVETSGNQRKDGHPIRAFYADRDMEVRPGVGGFSSLEGFPKRGQSVRGAYAPHEELLKRGDEVASQGDGAAEEAGK